MNKTAICEVNNGIGVTSKPKPICMSCNKVYTDERALTQHYERSQICKKWVAILSTKSILAKRIQELHSNFPRKTTNTCTACKKEYSNIGNLNKHLKNNPVCRKLTDWITYN